MAMQGRSGKGLARVVRGIADGLRPEAERRLRVCWSDDADAPEPGPGVIALEWGDLETEGKAGYFAPDIEGPDWMEKRRQRFGG